MQGESRRERRRRQAESPNLSTQPWYRLPPSLDTVGRVLVIGGGLAGCCLARAMAERDRDVVLLERGAALAAGASGNPAGVAKPFVTRAPSTAMDFYRAAFAELQAWLAGDDLARRCGYQACGALQLTTESYPAGDGYDVLDRATAGERVKAAVPSGGIHFQEAGWLQPAAFCRAVAEHPRIAIRTRSDVVSVERRQGSNPDAVSAETRPDNGAGTANEHWRVTTADGRHWAATTLVLANGMGIIDTAWTRDLPLLAARGQLSRFAVRHGASAPTGIIAGKHYVIPEGDSIYVGATFERDSDDTAVRTDDHTSNLVGLSALLPGISVDPAALSGHAGVRATTPDRLPLLGPVADLERCATCYADLAHGRPESSYPALPVIPGLATLGGFGSRGIVSAPFSARLVVDWLCGGTELQAWMPLVHPVRFTVRALRRN